MNERLAREHTHGMAYDHRCPRCRKEYAEAVQPTDDYWPSSERDTPEGWVWECVSCDRPVPPMGMCETCGVFGVMRVEQP